jgi:hypothetical protein
MGKAGEKPDFGEVRSSAFVGGKTMEILTVPIQPQHILDVTTQFLPRNHEMFYSTCHKPINHNKL